MSFQIHNIFKINKPDTSLYDFVFKSQNEFTSLLNKRADKVIDNHIEEFIEEFKEHAMQKNIAIPKNKQQWYSLAYRQLKRDVANQKHKDDIYCDSVFFMELNDFIVNALLLRHPDTKEYFIMLFGSPWAINALRKIMHLADDFSFDDRSDAGYENNMEQMEKDRQFLLRMFPNPRYKDNGIMITISDEVPPNYDKRW